MREWNESVIDARRLPLTPVQLKSVEPSVTDGTLLRSLVSHKATLRFNVQKQSEIIYV